MSASIGDAHQSHPVSKLDRLKAGAEHMCCMWLQLALNLSNRPATVFIPISQHLNMILYLSICRSVILVALNKMSTFEPKVSCRAMRCSHVFFIFTRLIGVEDVVIIA
jgi:hypothetical protein